MTFSINESEKRILQNITIPPRPEVLITVSQELKKAEPDVKVVADAISHDVSIAAGVLQIVNSAAYRRARSIESIRQAVMVLGLKRIYSVVRAVALRNAVAGSIALEGLWEMSSLLADACLLVAKKLKRHELEDNAYLIGLFHMVGVPVMLHNFHDYEQIIVHAHVNGWDCIITEETSKYGTGHPTIGALLADRWQLPTAVVETIFIQHAMYEAVDNEDLNFFTLDLLAILHVARKLVSDTNEILVVDKQWDDVSELVIQQLGYHSVTELENFIESLKDEV